MFSKNITTKDLSRAKKYFEDIISFTVGPFTLDEIITHRVDTINIVDVRNYEDYIEGHIPYAIHIPHKEIQEHCEMLNKEKVTVVYSYSDSCPCYPFFQTSSFYLFQSIIVHVGFQILCSLFKTMSGTHIHPDRFYLPNLIRIF